MDRHDHPETQAALTHLTAALKQTELLQNLSVEILGILNDDFAFSDAIHRVVTAIKRSTGVDAVGIRMLNDQDYPYLSQEGFADSFVRAESRLVALSRTGQACIDNSGKPCLECTCGLVIAGRTDPSNPVFTPYGSFHVNRGGFSPGFPSGDNDTRYRSRNRCLQEGFTSIALIPVRVHHEVIGLLQLNDRRPDCLSPELIRFLEGLSSGIGLALLRKRAEEELSANKSKLELALTSANMGTWRWDIGPDIRVFDKQTCQLLGLEPTSFGGTVEEFLSALHPDDRDQVKASLQRTLETDATYETEYRAIWQDGSIHYISARGCCTRDDRGQPTSINGIIWDTTEHRLMQKALRERERELLEAQRLAHIGTWILELESGQPIWSAEMFRICGFDPERNPPLYSEHSKYIHPDDFLRLNAAVMEAIANGKPYALELRIHRPDGGHRIVVAHGETQCDAYGNVLRLRGTLQDITERKQAEKALSESEGRYRSLFQESHDALMTLAPPSWRFTSGNAAAVAMFGAQDEADFVLRAPWQFSPECQADGGSSSELALEYIDSAMREGSVAFNWTHRRVSGEDFPATVQLSRIEINGSALLQATVRDDSEKVRLQASMAQADRLASMGMLAAGVAHEINNPLAYVRYNVESLAQDLPRLVDATQRACTMILNQLGTVWHAQVVGEDAEILEPAALADAIDRANESLEGVERIVAITRDLSKFSRVEHVNWTQVDIKIALEAAVNMTHNEVLHRARLIRDIRPVPRVWASEGKLSQVFLNLLVNAAHAIDEGDVTGNQITVRTWSEEGDVCVEIADTGRGIPPENLERIFEPFYTTKPVGVGSGLGLSISKNILAEFKGSLTVSSEVGKGSRFRVRLPVMKELESESRWSPAVEKLPTAVQRGRILVIEDEESIRKSLVRLLGGDHEVATVTCGQEAQKLMARDSAFDLVICDLMMAPMSGIEFHAWLAVEHPLLARQLVFITGGAFTANAREYLASVGNLIVQKPFDAKTLRVQVSKMIHASRVAN
jgi:PAS domain S-box-containing protein